MTYSRPGIRGSNVSAGQQLGNDLRIELPDPVRRTPDAPYRDQRNPAQAGENAKLKFQAINDLLEFAGSPQTQKFIADQIDASAKREAGKVLDSYPALNTTSTDNPEAIAALNGLSPRAKDFVIEAQTANAVTQYGVALEAEFAARPIISAAGDTPAQQEQRAKAIAEAQAAARDNSGLSSLPAFQITKNAQQLASYDGVVQGNAYKQRLATQTDLAQVGLMQGAASQLAEGWKGISEVSAPTDQPVAPAMGVVVDGIVDAAANNFGPTGQARVLAGGIGEALNRISDPGEKLQFLQALQERASIPKLGADGKTDVFSIPLAGGKSIKDVLDGMIPGAEDQADKAIMGKAYLEALRLQESGQVEQARDLMLSQAELLNDPTAIPTFISQLERLTTRVTPEMRQRGYAMFERQLGDEDAGALVKEMIAAEPGTYSPQDINMMFSLARQGGENVDYKRKRQSFRGARADAGDAYDVGFSNYLRYTGLGKKAYTGVGDGTLSQDGLKAQFTFLQEVQARYFAKMDETDPAKFDPLKAIESSMNETIDDAKAKAGSNKGVASDPQQQYVGWAKSSLNALAQTAGSGGGRIESRQIPAAAISPATLQAWQQVNPQKSFDSLTGLQKEQLLVRSIQSYKKFDAAKQQYVNYTEQEAKERVKSMLQEAERQAANNPGGSQQRVPEVVPETPEELKQVRGRYSSGVNGRRSGAVEKAMELLEKAASWSVTPQKDPFNFNKVFNNGGFGPQAMSYVDSFLNMTLGAAPATATQLDYGAEENLEALRQSWSSGQEGLNTAPLPQVAAATPVRYAPVAITSDKHELFVMVGVAEGTRTASGGYTKAYYGHRDMGDGNWNRGTVSGGRGTNASPQMVDRKWMGTLTNVQQRMRGPLIANGLEPGTAGFNRVMFNLIDLTVQSPAAARDFAGKLPEMRQKGWTIEAIAKARSDSFINPATGRLDAPGFGNNYQRLFKDQRSRAGVYDYRRRI